MAWKGVGYFYQRQGDRDWRVKEKLFVLTFWGIESSIKHEISQGLKHRYWVILLTLTSVGYGGINLIDSKWC